MNKTIEQNISECIMGIFVGHTVPVLYCNYLTVLTEYCTCTVLYSDSDILFDLLLTKHTYCKSLWLKASAKFPKCKCN